MPAVLVGAFADAALLLLYLLGWAITLGLLYTWNATFHHLFKGIADALSFTIHGPLGWNHTFHLGDWANSIDHAAQSLLSDWALGNEILVGKFWHALTWVFDELSHSISNAAQATLDLGHAIGHRWIPNAIDDAMRPWRTKTNKAAAAAGAAGLLAGLLKKAQRAEHSAERAATSAAKSAARAAGHEAHAAKSVATTVEHTIVHETKVITQVVDVGALPAQFGRTVKQIRRRLGKVEALLGATAMAVAMANVLGIPSWRCLTKGPIGRTARALCGIPTNLLNDLLGLIVDFFILENVCTVLPFLEAAVSEVAVPLVAVLTDVGAGLCHGSIGATKPLQGPVPTTPPYTYANPLAA